MYYNFNSQILYFCLLLSKMRKESQDEQTINGANSAINFAARIQKIQAKSQKMYQNLDDIVGKTINAIGGCQQQISKSQQNWNNSLKDLHIKMTQIKPLKSIKDQYNDFYKKLSGFGKVLEEVPAEAQLKIKIPKLYEDEQLYLIQQSLSDHYLSQKNYDAAYSIYPENTKKKLFQESFELRNDILQGKFDRTAQWLQRAGLREQQGAVTYEIYKMKVISLVNQNKANEAIAYLRKNLSSFANQYGMQISKLMNFIITHSNKYWGSQTDYTEIYKNRYSNFTTVSLQQLANKFTQIYLKTNKIYNINPITQCHEVGLKFRQQFLQQVKYLPEDKQLPTILPFSIKTGNQYKYHSHFFCPVSKQVFGPLDKNVMLNCGHMVSNLAISKITQGRDSRRKLKCPICQSDQVIENNMKVQF